MSPVSNCRGLKVVSSPWKSQKAGETSPTPLLAHHARYRDLKCGGKPLWGSFSSFTYTNCNGGLYCLLLQGEENPKRGSKKPRGRACKLCKAKLPTGYSKQSCKDCISQVLGEETPPLVSSLRDIIKEEINSSLKNLQPDTSGPSQRRVSVKNISGSEDEGPGQLETVDLNSPPSSDKES